MNRLNFLLIAIIILIFNEKCEACGMRLAKFDNDTLTDYQILTDSTIKYDFGYACYYAGMPPEGRQAIDNLIKNKDYKIIMSILDGQNNEGKIYAIEALLILNSKEEIKLTELEKGKIKSIIEEDLEIYRCQGCLVSTIKTIDLFNEKDFKELLKKNQIEIAKR